MFSSPPLGLTLILTNYIVIIILSPTIPPVDGSQASTEHRMGDVREFGVNMMLSDMKHPLAASVPKLGGQVVDSLHGLISLSALPLCLGLG